MVQVSTSCSSRLPSYHLNKWKELELSPKVPVKVLELGLSASDDRSQGRGGRELHLTRFLRPLAPPSPSVAPRLLGENSGPQSLTSEEDGNSRRRRDKEPLSTIPH